MSGQVRTVLGDVDPESLGVTLAHEHLIIDSQLVAEEWPHIHLPSVEEAVAEATLCHGSGVGAMVDAMPIGSGGDPLALRDIARLSGVAVIASTGMHTLKYYRDVSWAHDDPVDDLANRFVTSILVGVDRVRAGVLKVATAGDYPDSREREIFEAAAIAHSATGVPVLTHCQEGRGGAEQIELLVEMGVGPDRIAMSHTDKVADPGYHRDLLDSGAFLCYDQGLRSPEQTVELVAAMFDAGMGDRLLIGTDGARRSLWSTLGGAPGLAWIHTGFLDLLSRRGLAPGDLDRLFITNPARWLALA